MATQQTTGFTEKMLWASMYGKNAEESGGAPVRLTLPYALTPEVVQQINTAATFLHSIKSINTEKLRPEALMPEFAQAILKERGLSAPIGKVSAMADGEYKSSK